MVIPDVYSFLFCFFSYSDSYFYSFGGTSKMNVLTVPNFLFSVLVQLFRSDLTVVFFMPIIVFTVILIVVGVIKYVLSIK